MRTLHPGDCIDQLLPCFCYSQQSVKLISQELQECELVRYELEEYAKLVELKGSNPWYEDPNFLVGSVIVSISVGVLLGYAIAK